MSAYQSTLPRRTRPIEAADFKRASALSVHPHSFAVPNSIEAELSLWNRMIPFLPKTLLTFYEEAFRTSVDVEVHFLNKHCGTPSPEYFSLHVDSANSIDFFGNVCFMNGRKLVDRGSSIRVDNDARGKGLGKTWLKSIVELSLAFGDEELRFQASDENGAYSWAKAGAFMDMALEDAFKRTYLSQKVIGRLEAVRPFIPSGDYHKARALARFTGKDDINRLAAMTTIVPAEVFGDLQSSESQIRKRLIEFYARLSVKEQPEFLATVDNGQLCTAFYGAAHQKRELSLPRFLLSCTSWEARIDFTDEKQMWELGTYLGGWKTIEPVKGQPVQQLVPSC